MASPVKRAYGRARPATAVVALALSVLLVALAASAWRLEAQRQERSADASVRILGTGDRSTVADPEDRGATYYWIESQASRVTTRFSDAVAVTDRITGGDLRTRLTDLAGNELATFNLDRVGGTGGSDVIEIRVAGASPVRMAGHAGLRPTLDWGNRQAYSLWKDMKASPDARFEWQGTVVRARGAARRPADDGILDVRTDWPGGISAVTARRVEERTHVVTGARRRGPALFGRLTRDDVEIGRIEWYVQEQVLSWAFPGLTEGYVDAERLASIGGWPFSPDLAWTNVQGYALHYFHALMATNEAAAERGGGWLQKLAGFWVPTVLANEPGCDGLHWLDGSVFRPCCDSHDRCYEKIGCSWHSWWLAWTSWSCTKCNASAVFCFATGGKYPFRRF
jgi:hypothetical protein